jgi:hypothetical protein
MEVNNLESSSNEEDKKEDSSEFTFQVSSSESRDSDVSSQLNPEQILRHEELKKEALSMEERLNRWPPDFAWAKKHREANMAKPQIEGRNIKDFEDEEKYWAWCHRPTDKVVKKYNLCVKISELGDLGVGIPLYFNFKIINIIIFFFFSVWMIYPLISNIVMTRGSCEYTYFYELDGVFKYPGTNYYYGPYFVYIFPRASDWDKWHDDYPKYRSSCTRIFQLYECDGDAPVLNSCENDKHVCNDNGYRWNEKYCCQYDTGYTAYVKPVTVNLTDIICKKTDDIKSLSCFDDRGYEWIEDYDEDDRSLVRWASMREYKWSLIYYETYQIILQQWLNWMWIVTIIVCSIALRIRQQRLIEIVDDKNVTPSDFWVFVSNLPTDKTPEEVKAWIKGMYPGIQIAYVNFWYNVWKITRAEKRLKSLKKMKYYVTSYKEKVLNEEKWTEEEAIERGINLLPPSVTRYFIFKCNFTPAPILELYIDKFERSFKLLKKDMEENTQNYSYWGNAFVVFNKQSDAVRLVEDFHIPTITRIYAFIVNKILCWEKLRYSKRLWENRNINIERPEEPSDYYWENLAIRTKFRVKRSILTFFLNFWSLGAALAIYAIIYQIVFGYIDPIVKKRSEQERDIITRVALTFNSFLTMIVNGILCKIGRFLSYVERHETKSKYRSSEGFKLTIVLFINSCMIPMLLNWIINKDNYFKNVATDIYSLAVSLSFYEPVLQMLSVTWMIKKWKGRREFKKGEKSIMSQRQANLLFEGVEFMISERYAKTMLLFLLVCLFAYPIPLIPFVAFGGSIFQYMVDKYLLLRRYKLPEQMGPSTAQTFTTLLPFGCVIYSTSLLYFSHLNLENKNHRILGIILLVLSTLYFFVPLTPVIKYFRKKTEEKRNAEEAPTYAESCLFFATDYNRANPVTEREAKLKHLRKLLRAGRISSNQYEEQKEELEENFLPEDLDEVSHEDINRPTVLPYLPQRSATKTTSNSNPPSPVKDNQV